MVEPLIIEGKDGCVARLYCCDCRDVLPSISGVNLVCSDVPYKLTSGGSGTQVMGGSFAQDAYNNDGDFVLCDIAFHEFMGPVFDACATDADAYFITNARNFRKCGNAAEDAGWKDHNIVVWDKGTSTRNRWYMNRLEFTNYVFKGRARALNNCGSVNLISTPNPRNKFHVTEKPVLLNKRYIENSSDPGDLVMDPFMGSGSTGVAALQLGRNFIGIEQVPEIFDIAARRIEAAAQGRHFDRPMAVKSKAMEAAQ